MNWFRKIFGRRMVLLRPRNKVFNTFAFTPNGRGSLLKHRRSKVLNQNAIQVLTFYVQLINSYRNDGNFLYENPGWLIKGRLGLDGLTCFESCQETIGLTCGLTSGLINNTQEWV
jgi:hypothetical protein